jgi:hypothetical protein
MLSDLVNAQAHCILGQNRDLIARFVLERRRFEKWLQHKIFESLMPTHPRSISKSHILMVENAAILVG